MNNALDLPAATDRPVAAGIRLVDETRLLVVSALAGLALGIGDLFWMRHVDAAWASIANSSAVWATGAFALGAVLRTDPVRAAIGGVVMMSVAVESYYAYAASVDLASLSSPLSANARTWLVFGVFAGVGFGAAGAWASSGVRWQQILGAATGAGVLVGEALLISRDLPADGGFHDQMAQAASAMCLLAALLLVATTRRPTTFAAAALLTVPAALFCAAAFEAVGISF